MASPPEARFIPSGGSVTIMTGSDGRLPEMVAERCVHSMTDRAGCSACITACPRHAWVLADDSLGLDAEACDGCGLCVPACPQGAIALPFVPLLNQSQGVRLALLACEYSGVASGRPGRLPCIHSVGLRDVLHLFADGVRLLGCCTAECTECPRGGGNLLQHRIAALNDALGRPGSGELIAMEPLSPARWTALAAGSDQRKQRPAISRRRFLGSLIDQEGLDQHEPASTGGAMGASCEPPGRLLPEPTGQARWPHVPSIAADLCVGCDACERLCPQSAISLKRADAGGLAYHIEARSCSGCGICVDLCDTGAASLSEWVIQRQHYLALETRVCSSCGAPFHRPTGDRRGAGSRCWVCSDHQHRRSLHQVME